MLGSLGTRVVCTCILITLALTPFQKRTRVPVKFIARAMAKTS